MYHEGWKINELAKKFGALPQRIKFNIWNIQHFFEEVVPKKSIPELCEKLLDEDYNFQENKIDYGIDLQHLAFMKYEDHDIQFTGKETEH